MPKVYIKTFGCQMNKQESQVMAELLRSDGYMITSAIDSADIVILETCAIRKKAEDKVYSLIGMLRKLKERKGIPRHIVICGCIATEDGAEEFIKNLGVSAVLGPRRIARIPHILRKIEIEPVIDISDDWEIPPEDVSAPDIPGISAFVTVMQGCSNDCSYCVVPSRRGKAESRNLEDIILEINFLHKKGYKEVTLLGQNISFFGIDKKGHPRLIDLLERIDAETRIERIRFATSHPAYINQDFICRVSKLKRIMPNVHLPVQSGSDRILKSMRRGYSASKFLDLVKAFRAENLFCSITTDFITGYADETIDDFQQSIQLVKETQLDGAYVFPYSERPGTRAFESEFESVVPRSERNKRCFELLKEVERTAKERRKLDIGRTVEVLVEKKGKGRSKENINVTFNGGEPGQFVKVRIEDFTPFALIGRMEE